ncbi:hypothetical protein SME36J_46150 [Serratia marcescens]|nr:hypothetical protein SME36J_46150 [Serratia marcescens]
MEYELDIKENAMDSLNEALAKYELGGNSVSTNSQYCIFPIS